MSVVYTMRGKREQPMSEEPAVKESQWTCQEGTSAIEK